MRNPVRKFLGASLIAMVGLVVLAPALAGAQTTTTTTFVPGEGAPPVPGECTFTVTPATVDTTPADVTVSGTAPVGVTVELFVNSSTTPVATQVVPATGTFSFPYTVTVLPTSFDVNYTYGNKNAYVQGCTTVSGEVVQRVAVSVAAAQALAFTGSDNTPTYVVVGIAAVVVGLVFVVAARRRSRAHG